MSDVVVTVPHHLWFEWLREGDLANGTPEPAPWEGANEYTFYLATRAPDIKKGERVYIVAHRRLRGYAPLEEAIRTRGGSYGLVRRGGAVAVTIDDEIRGFRGFRYRWWERSQERPFPDWQEVAFGARRAS